MGDISGDGLSWEAPYVDLANLNTLPANFEQVAEPADSFRFESCDVRGCTLASATAKETT